MAVVSVVPAVYWSGVNQMFVLPKLSLVYLLSLILVVVVGVRYLTTRSIVIYADRTTVVLAAAFVLLVLISTALSIHKPTSLLGDYGRYEGLFTIISYMVIFFAATQINWRSGNRLGLIATVMTGTAVFLGAIGFLEGFGVRLVRNVEIRDWMASRAAVTFGNPDIAGTYMAMALMVALGVTLVMWAHNRRQAVIPGVGLAVITAALLATSTRSAWIAAAIGLLVMTILATAKLRRRLVAIFLVLAIIAVGVSALTVGLSGRVGIAGRLFSVTRLSEGTMASRIEIWKIAVRMISDRPFIGSGLNTSGLIFPRYIDEDYIQAAGPLTKENNVHSYLLEVAVAGGLPLLLVWLALIGRSIVLWLKSRVSGGQDYMLEVGFVCSCLVYLLSTGVSVNAPDIGALFWLMLGVLVGLTYSAKNQRLLVIDWDDSTRRLRQTLVGLIVGVAFLAALGVAIFFAADNQYVRGRMLLKSGWPDQALPYFESAARLNPYINDYQESQGLVLVELRNKGRPRSEQEIAIFKQAVSRNPYVWKNHIRLVNAELMAARLLNEPRHLDEAEKALGNAFRLKPVSAVNNYLRAVLFLERSKEAEAKRWLLSAIRLDPDYDQAKSLLAELEGDDKK